MTEYIEREKAFKLIKEQKEKETGAYSKGRNKGLIIAGSIINNKEVLPTADVVEVKHGEWIEEFKDGFWYYDCPFCDDGYVVMEQDENKPNYCHNCGAKMDVSKMEITTEGGKAE